MSECMKALMLASVASMIDQFNLPNIELLQSLGYQVDVVTDFTNPGNITNNRSDQLKIHLSEMGVRAIDIAIPRSLNPKKIFSAYRNVKKQIMTEHYDLIHCHSPIGGAIARYAARKERKSGTKVIYTAHGFHFYSGAPFINWLLFYPIEKCFSKYTDVLITINKEDFKRASEKFKALKTMYVHGIGVDISRFGSAHNGTSLRKELGIGDSDIMFLSVGELNSNKNHEIVIKALTKLPNNLVYVIVGKGTGKDYLNRLVSEEGLQNRVKLVGFREDVADFYDASDAFIFPSFREGLSVSLMEAMASGLPVACSEIRGNVDLIDMDGGVFFNPADENSVADAIKKLLESDKVAMSDHNIEKINDFSLDTVLSEMRNIYNSF